MPPARLSKAPLLSMETLLLPGGSFTMGSASGSEDERPPHVVTIPPFRACLRPVTNAEYAAFVAATNHEAPPFLEDARFNDPDQPVVGISWHEAQAFCRWLSRRTSIRFRLPTEAEREYAAIGGLESLDWPWGERQNFDSEIASLERPHIPRESCLNAYGLYCMADNVHEWCSDWYDAGYYAVSPEESPSGPSRGDRRASRGGSWRHLVKSTRVTARSSLRPDYRYNDYGFRVYADA